MTGDLTLFISLMINTLNRVNKNNAWVSWVTACFQVYKTNESGSFLL